MATQTSGAIGGYIYGAQRVPPVQLFEWSILETSSPVGVRNIYSGHPAWVKELGTTISKAMEFEDVILNYADSALSGRYQSRVQCFTLGLASPDYAISNMRLWMASGTALQSSGHIEFSASGTWIPNAHLPSGIGSTMPVALPAARNILREDDINGDLQNSEDYHTSQFVYMAITVPSGFGLGRYGLGENGHIAFKIAYDWFYRFAPSGGLT